MQRLIKDIRGVSPVIATLMLTLIAVTAASSFGLFVAQKQEERQEAEWQQTLQEIEEITLLGLSPDIENNWLNLSVQNTHTGPSQIVGIRINNALWWINKTGQPFTYLNNSDFRVESYEYMDYNINLSADNGVNDTVETNKPITIKLNTYLGNSFEKTFYPPTAIIHVDIESLPSSNNNYYILDGSLSDHPGDGYIVKWEWNVTNMSSTPPSYLQPEPFGRKVQITDMTFLSPGYNYWVNLTVTDNYGMKGQNSFYYKL